MDSKVCFYREWLTLPKNDFCILAMLAEQGGSFKGSLADILGNILNAGIQTGNSGILYEFKIILLVWRCDSDHLVFY